MKKGIIDYIIYGLIVLVILLGIYYFFINKTQTSNTEEPKEDLIVPKNVIDLNVDESVKLIAYVTNNSNASIKYVSTNPSIATIDDAGNIKGISNGTTYIIINYVSSKNENFTKQVVVNVSGGIEVTSINLPNGELLMRKGDTYNLVVTTEPSNVPMSKLSYIVNDQNIISVSENGVITANNEGVAVLRVTAKENVNADILVRVVDNSNVISGIYVMPENISTIKNITLKVDEERDFDYVVEPIDAYMENIIYQSDNQDVLTITNGKMKAIKEGQAKVSMKTINGIEVYKYVDVKPQIVEISDLILKSSSNLELKVGDSSQIVYEILPVEATDKSVTFQSNNTSIVTVNETGLITAVGKGTTVIRISTSNQSKTIDVLVTVTEKSSSGSSNCRGETHVGNVNQSLLGAPSDEGFNKCKKASQNLVPFIGGTNYGQDGFYVMHVGETLTVNVKLPTICGRIDTLTRNNYDGETGWSNYVSQSSSPKINRYDSSTFLPGVDSYTWKITAKKKGCVIVSQTAQFDVTSPGGKKGNMKSMVKLHIKIED